MNRQYLIAVIASTGLLLACSDDAGSNLTSDTGLRVDEAHIRSYGFGAT